MQFVLILLILTLLTSTAFGQSPAFTYQGRLNTSGNPATGTYEIQFELFDSIKGGTQIGTTVTDSAVAVVNGVFTTTLDFGTAAFDGSPRFLEIGVRVAKDPNPFTILSPRQPINSVPYAVRSTNAAQLGGVDASQYVTTKTGPTNFIQNTTTPQSNANLNIDGNGTVGSLDANGPVSMAGTAEPAPAPAGQGRIYFDAATNKVKVSENSGAFVNLVGASGVSGSGSTNSVPLWSGGTTLGSSLITQSANGVQLPNGVQLAPGSNGNVVAFGSPNSETGMTMSGSLGRADVRFDGTTLRLLSGPPGSPPSNGISISPTTVGLPSAVSLAATASGNSVGFGSPNSETGMTISGASGRADIRYNGTLKILNGPGGIPPSGNGIEISQSGNVNVGNYSGNVAKLMVAGGTDYGLSAYNTSSSNDAIRGINNGPGTGVAGWSNGGTGVFGSNGLGGGTGVYAISQTAAGTALYVDGNARQSLGNGGLIKAMALVRVVRSSFPDPPMATASIVRCYNSLNNTSTGNCGITFGTVFTTSGVQINFGFNVISRFVSLTGNNQSTPSISGYPNANTVEVVDGVGTVEFFVFIY